MKMNLPIQKKFVKELITKKYVMLFVLIMLLSSVGVTFAAPRIASTLSSGTGYDPLSAGEQQRALNAARGGNAALNTAKTERTEVLLVERHQENKDTYRQGVWPRRSDVYIYHYDTDTLEHAVVNNATNKVDERTFRRAVQLPPTQNEIQISIDYILADPNLRLELNQWFKQLTGTDLVSADQIEGKGFIFHADSMGVENAGAAAKCGINRCVQMLIYTKDVIAFDISPVMNLSTQQLLALPLPAQ